MAKQSNINKNKTVLQDSEYIMSKKQIEELNEEIKSDQKLSNKIQFRINAVDAESFKKAIKNTEILRR